MAKEFSHNHHQMKWKIKNQHKTHIQILAKTYVEKR